MKVRCIDTNGSCILDVGKVYEVLAEPNEYYLIKTELGRCIFLKRLFEVVKEGNMENFCRFEKSKNCYLNNCCKNCNFYEERLKNKIKEGKEENKIVKKLKDLDGLKNGMGLIMKYDTEKVFDIEEKTLSILVEHNLEILYKVDVEMITSLKHILEIAKSMGFKFEYKPLRTKEEIMKDLVEKEFKFGDENFILIQRVNGKYEYMLNTSYYTLDTKYYTKDSIKRVVEELNELINK